MRCVVCLLSLSQGTFHLGVASSKALLSGASLQEVCDVAAHIYMVLNPRPFGHSRGLKFFVLSCAGTASHQERHLSAWRSGYFDPQNVI